MKYCKINLCVKEIHIHPNEGSQFLKGKVKLQQKLPINYWANCNQN